MTSSSASPLSTINDLFLRVASAANPKAIAWQDEFGHWQPISSDQIYQRVRQLGGNCQITSRPGQGTKIEFYLPLKGLEHGSSRNR